MGDLTHIDLFSGIMKGQVQMEYNSFYQVEHDRSGIKSRPYRGSCSLQNATSHYACILVYGLSQEPLFLHKIGRLWAHLDTVYKSVSDFRPARFFPSILHSILTFSVSLYRRTFPRTLTWIPLHSYQNIPLSNVACYSRQSQQERTVCHIAGRNDHPSAYVVREIPYISYLHKIVNNIDSMQSWLRTLYHTSRNILLAHYHLDLFSYSISQCVMFVKKGGAICLKKT